MLIGISKTETEDYISEQDGADSEEEGATVFVLGALDGTTRAWIIDRSNANEIQKDGTSKITNYSGSRMLNAVRFGLRGWRHFRDEKGNDIPFKTVQRYLESREYTAASDESLDALGFGLIYELGNKILDLNTVNKQLEKKSDPPA